MWNIQLTIKPHKFLFVPVICRVFHCPKLPVCVEKVTATKFAEYKAMLEKATNVSNINRNCTIAAAKLRNILVSLSPIKSSKIIDKQLLPQSSSVATQISKFTVPPVPALVSKFHSALRSKIFHFNHWLEAGFISFSKERIPCLWSVVAYFALKSWQSDCKKPFLSLNSDNSIIFYSILWDVSSPLPT